MSLSWNVSQRKFSGAVAYLILCGADSHVSGIDDQGALVIGNDALPGGKISLSCWGEGVVRVAWSAGQVAAETQNIRTFLREIVAASEICLTGVCPHRYTGPCLAQMSSWLPFIGM